MLEPSYFVEFEGNKFPVWESTLDNNTPISVSYISLMNLLYDSEKGIYKNDLAKEIDERISYYMDEEELSKVKDKGELDVLIEYYFK